MPLSPDSPAVLPSLTLVTMFAAAEPRLQLRGTSRIKTMLFSSVLLYLVHITRQVCHGRTHPAQLSFLFCCPFLFHVQSVSTFVSDLLFEMPVSLGKQRFSYLRLTAELPHVVFPKVSARICHFATGTRSRKNLRAKCQFGTDAGRN